jgi:eukaryotic-like serine/threonine-protein kinase
VVREFRESSAGEDLTREVGAAELHEPRRSLSRGAMVGRYVLLDVLGTGGMGEVFAAYDPELDRSIALKLVKLSAGEETGQARERLIREAQALAKLSHPNVVAVYDVGTHGNRVFIAMEHVNGQTMRDWIKDAPKAAQSWREGLALMLQAGRGLAAAHAEGLVHRDFKPANVMVSADGRVRVLDFGLARRFDADDYGKESEPSLALAEARNAQRGRYSQSSHTVLRTQLTEAGLVMGTPAYMAPEQFAGGEIDARTDQFAFCVVLYQVLFSIRPFVGRGFRELEDAVTQGVVHEPSWATKVPRGVRQALRRGLSVSRESRYPSMNALLADLERGAGVRRRRMRIAVTAASVLLGLGALTALRATEAEVPCQGAEAKLEGVWDEPVRAALASAFESTSVVYADDARIGATRSLDGYAMRWVELHTQVCDATRVRGDQSETLMDLRIGCLEGKLRDMKALTTVLANADIEVVKNAIHATRALASPDECATFDGSTEELLRPRDPSVASAVESVAQARAQGLSGKYDDGIVLGQAARAAAEKAGHLPIIAEASLVLGDLHHRLSSAEPAAEAYEDALYAAAASGHARVEAQALIGLLSVRGTYLADTEVALRYGRHAEAVVERLGRPPELESALALYRGTTKMSASRLEAAHQEFNRAIAISEGVAEAERIHLASLHNLAITQARGGSYLGAAYTFQRVVELTEARLGPLHPTVGSNHLGLGVTYARLEDHERAMHHTRRALEIFERALGPGHPDLGRGYHNLGMVQSSSGDLPAAFESYQRALEIKIEALGPDHSSVAISANNLGVVLTKLGRPAEAIPHLDDALRIWTHAHGEDSPSNVVGLVSLAEAHLALERPADAVQLARRALTLAENGEIDPVELARSRFVAARAIWRAGGDRRKALELARQAKQGFDSLERPAHTELRAIESFLADPS